MTWFRADRGAPRSAVGARRPRRSVALAGVAATVVVGAVVTGLVLVSHSVSDDYVLDQARREARRMATSVAAPLVNERVHVGEPAALRRLSNALLERVHDGSAQHIQIWDRDGRILWADDPSRIGMQFDLSARYDALFDNLTEIAEVTPLEGDEHRGLDTEAEELLEVKVGALGSDGEPFLFEIYRSPTSVTEHRSAVLMALAPVAVGLLALVLVAAVPVVWLTGRQRRLTRRQHARILENALSAWHAERRRIAQDLHDGVVQNLSAVSYALPGVLDMLPDDPSAAHAKAVGRQLNQMLQHDLTALRTLITDQFPDLEGDGLRDALVALADRSSSLGLEVRLDLDLGLRPDVTVAGVLYRVVREGLRNVERHARATTALVRVAATADTVTVRVADDGQGLSGADTAIGHVGLRLLAGLLLDLGGTLELRGGPSGGTVLEARMPRELLPAALRAPSAAVTTPS
jgi:hypothetical protein